VKKYLINPDTGLIRAGWRILAFLVIFLAITAGAMIGVRTILGSLQRGSTLQFSILAVTATVAVFIARRYLDKKSLLSLGLRWDKFAILDILSGIVNSALVMAGTYFAMLWAGLIEYHGFSWWMDGESADAGLSMAALPIAAAVFYQLMVVAWWEELAFRGYFFQNLISGIGLKWSVVVCSLVFGFGHALNPNATILSSLLIALITPQLIYAYLKTGQLWLPMGLHLGWNFFQASVFGFAASGQESPSLISQSPVGPEWLSGGAFGAEGSLIILPWTILSFFLIHYWVRATRQPGQKAFASMINTQ
jgi:membrane protease YdiL (CAAX protease family)